MTSSLPSGLGEPPRDQSRTAVRDPLERALCPACGAVVEASLGEGDEYQCEACERRYRVVLDATSERAVFVETHGAADVEPLGLPKGSVRALAALALAGCCWYLVVIGRDVSGALLSVVLSVISYYYGFRSRGSATARAAHEVSSTPDRPLFLPAGAIRGMLVAGFLISGVLLSLRGHMVDAKYAEFFLVLAGLIAGYLMGRMWMKTHVDEMLGLAHLTALGMLGVVGLLVYLFVTGQDAQLHPLALSGLCGAVSFYFGSRS